MEEELKIEEGTIETNDSESHNQLKSIVERIERLEDEKATIGADIKEVYAEAKANGFDTKVLRKVISLRRKDENERQEEMSLIDLYLSSLGMLSPTIEEN